jgi:hypothetical protein
MYQITSQALLRVVASLRENTFHAGACVFTSPESIFIKAFWHLYLLIERRRIRGDTNPGEYNTEGAGMHREIVRISLASGLLDYITNSPRQLLFSAVAIPSAY